MIKNTLLVSTTLLASALALAAYTAGCGSSDDNGFVDPDASNNSDVDPFGGDGSPNQTVLDVQPKNPVIDYPTATTQQFKAYVLGSPTPIPASWGIDKGALGTIDQNGLFTASGNQGGTTTVTATSGKASGYTQLSVILHLQENPGNITASDQSKLKAGGSADPNFKWLYPYEATVFPRGLAAPVMQFGGTAPTAFYVHIKAKYIDYEGFCNLG